MKKILLSGILMIGLLSFSQTTITSGTLDKKKPLVKFDYLPITNRLIVEEAYDRNSQNGLFNYALVFDALGKRDSIIKKDNFVELIFSKSEKNYKLFNQNGYFSKPYFKFFNNGKDYTEITDCNNCHGTFADFFTDIYQLKLMNQKKNFNIKIESDILYLEKHNFITNTTKSISIKYPNINRLKSKDLDIPSRIAFQKNIYDDKSFELITKSVSKDNKSMTLYKTKYDLEGKLLSDIAFNILSPKGELVCVYNAHTLQNRYYSTPILTMNVPAKDLDINDHYVDPVTKDVYIFGISRDNGPLGFYLFKFDEGGVKIWEKFYDIDNPKGFNQNNQLWNMLTISLYEYMDTKTIAISIDGEYSYTKRYNHFFIINKDNGNLDLSKTMDSYTDTGKGGLTSISKYSIFETTKLEKNKYCSEKTLLAYTLNDKVKKYIDGITGKKDVMFDTYISPKGLWLLESDNDDYYKVTLFKD